MQRQWFENCFAKKFAFFYTLFLLLPINQNSLIHAMTVWHQIGITEKRNQPKNVTHENIFVYYNLSVETTNSKITLK